MSKHILLLTILSFSIHCFAQASKQQVQNFNTKQPSRFTENKGQVTDQDGNLRNDVKYIYNSPGFKAIFKENSFSYEIFRVDKKPKEMSEATGKPDNNLLPEKFEQPEDITVKTHRIDISLPGANLNPEIVVEGKSSDYINYYLAYTPEHGVQKVYSYTKLTYRNIWPNVDLVFYAKKEGELKYDIVVNSRGKLSDVSFAYEGASVPKLTHGKLNLETSFGTLTEQIPLSYTLQERQKIDIRYKIKRNTISLSGKYNNENTLIIDPLIKWSTFYGGTYWDSFNSLDKDQDGNLLITGVTSSEDMIATKGAFQSTKSGVGNDIFLTKFTVRGTRIWATYYGSDGDDISSSVSADRSNSYYLAGSTSSLKGFSTINSYQQNHGGYLYDNFLAKFDNNGERVWATYYGGNGWERQPYVETDSKGNIYMASTTTSTNAISTPGSFQELGGPRHTAYVVKFNPTGDRLWGTYYGGDFSEILMNFTIDPFDNLYLTGVATSSNLATKNAHQTKHNGGSNQEYTDAFLTKFNSNGERIWATYYGGTGVDRSYDVVSDSFNVYIVGETVSKDFIATADTYQPSHNRKEDTFYRDAFVAKFDSGGVRKWATYYGGTRYDEGRTIDLDEAHNIFISGITTSYSYISTADGEQVDRPYNKDSMSDDCFIAMLDSSGHRQWASYLGGEWIDWASSILCGDSGYVYLVGGTSSRSFISTKGSHQDTSNSEDGFIMKLRGADAGIISLDSLSSKYCGDTLLKPFYIQVKNFSNHELLDSVYIGYSINDSIYPITNYSNILDFGDTSRYIILDTAQLIAGENLIKVWTFKPNGGGDWQKNNDTLTFITTLYPTPKQVITYNVVGGNVQFYVSDTTYSLYNWDFGDSSFSNEKLPSHDYKDTGWFQVRLTVNYGIGCTKTFLDSIYIDTILPELVISDEFEVNIGPNPISNQAVVKFTIPTASTVSVELLEYNGRKSAIIKPTHLAQGQYQFTLDRNVHNLKNGLFFIRFNVNGKSSIKRIIKIE